MIETIDLLISGNILRLFLGAQRGWPAAWATGRTPGRAGPPDPRPLGTNYDTLLFYP